MKKLTFDELVDELDERSAEELGEISELSRKYAIEKRREEIAQNAEQAMNDWKSGKLKAFDSVEDLMKSLDE